MAEGSGNQKDDGEKQMDVWDVLINWMWGVKERGIRNNLQMSAWALGWTIVLNWGRLGLSKQGVVEVLGGYITSSVLTTLETSSGISSTNAEQAVGYTRLKLQEAS